MLVKIWWTIFLFFAGLAFLCWLGPVILSIIVLVLTILSPFIVVIGIIALMKG